MLASPCRSGGPPIWFFLSLALCPLACHVLCMTKVGIRSSQPGIQPYPRKSKNVLATRSKCPGERSCWHGCLLSWQIPFLPPSLLGVRLGGLDRPRGSIRGQPTCCTWRCWDAQRRVGCWRLLVQPRCCRSAAAMCLVHLAWRWSMASCASHICLGSACIRSHGHQPCVRWGTCPWGLMATKDSGMRCLGHDQC